MNNPQRTIASPLSTSPPPRLSLRQENVRLRQRIAELEQDNHLLGATNLRRAQTNRPLADAGRILKTDNDQMERTIIRMDDRIAELKDERAVLERELEHTRRKAVEAKTYLREKVAQLEEQLEGKGLRGWIKKVVGRGKRKGKDAGAEE